MAGTSTSKRIKAAPGAPVRASSAAAPPGTAAVGTVAAPPQPDSSEGHVRPDGAGIHNAVSAPTPEGQSAQPSLPAALPGLPANLPAAPLPRLQKRRASSGGRSARPNEPHVFQIALYQYAADGSLCHAAFDAEYPVFALMMKHDGSKQSPSVCFKMKEALGDYLQALHQQSNDPDSPLTLQDLVP